MSQHWLWDVYMQQTAIWGSVLPSDEAGHQLVIRYTSAEHLIIHQGGKYGVMHGYCFFQLPTN
jgi:hypothetical protein